MSDRFVAATMPLCRRGAPGLGRAKLFVILALSVIATFMVTSAAFAADELVIKNARIMTASHGTIPNGSVYIKDGKIAAVGASVNAPASAKVIDAGGKVVTPGIIDSHSHMALGDDVNEATNP